MLETGENGNQEENESPDTLQVCFWFITCMGEMFFYFVETQNLYFFCGFWNFVRNWCIKTLYVSK